MCIVHGPRLFQRRGPIQSSSLHRPFHRSLIHIHRRPSLLTYQHPASCDWRPALPIIRFPLWEHSHLSAPSPHPVQWLLFFTLTQWHEKKKRRTRRRVAATAGRVPPTAAGNRSTASEMVAERASSMAACN